MYIVTNSQQLDEGTMYYVCTDNLGSITHLVDDYCSPQEEMSYDACLPVRSKAKAGGRRRKPDKWCDYNVSSTHIIDRGFTGHEHLDLFGLINMNGRVYVEKTVCLTSNSVYSQYQLIINGAQELTPLGSV